VGGISTERPGAQPVGHQEVAPEQLRAGVVSATDPATLAAWRKVQEFNARFVGVPDDQDLEDYTRAAQAAYGHLPALADIADTGKTSAFAERVGFMRPPRIAPLAKPSFRFIPAPYTLDADIYQCMVYNGGLPGVGDENTPRYFALGLDIMAALSPEENNRAHTLLSGMQFTGSFFDFDIKETAYANYERQYHSARSLVFLLSKGGWSENLYTFTLHATTGLLGNVARPGEPYTQNAAWADRCLNTALGAWTELKHDTMPKLPAVIEAGGEGGISESPVPVQPVGYVEQAPRVYRTLLDMTAAERYTLKSLGYLSTDASQRIDTFAALLSMVIGL